MLRRCVGLLLHCFAYSCTGCSTHDVLFCWRNSSQSDRLAVRLLLHLARNRRRLGKVVHVVHSLDSSRAALEVYDGAQSVVLYGGVVHGCYRFLVRVLSCATSCERFPRQRHAPTSTPRSSETTRRCCKRGHPMEFRGRPCCLACACWLLLRRSSIVSGRSRRVAPLAPSGERRHQSARTSL